MALNKKSVDDINVKGKRVLVRCDFNVPLKEGRITDETRIVAALPTINKLIADGGKVILCSHLGKVKNGPNEGESLAPVAERLSEKLGKPVNFVADYNVTGEAATAAVAAMNEGDVVLLQNTRFRGKEETKPADAGEAFAKELADLADVYVCDAFGSAHRAHASVAVVTKYISEKGGENAVGYLMQKEIDFLGNAVENPVRPFVAILGGAKVADKLNVINNLLEKCDTLIIGGGMAFTFLKAQGMEIGNSLVDDEKLDYCKEMMEKAEKLGKKLTTPDLAVLLGLYDHLGLPADVIFLLVGFCAERTALRYGEGRRPTMRQIEKEGYTWARLGLMTQESAAVYIRKYQRSRQALPRMMRLLRLGDRPPAPSEEKYLLAWEGMGFADEVIERAYDKTMLKCKELKWPYMNKILCSWHEKGLHTLEAVSAGDRPGRPAVQRRDEGQSAREDMARMEKYLEQLRREKEGQ